MFGQADKFKWHSGDASLHKLKTFTDLVNLSCPLSNTCLSVLEPKLSISDKMTKESDKDISSSQLKNNEMFVECLITVSLLSPSPKCYSFGAMNDTLSLSNLINRHMLQRVKFHFTSCLTESTAILHYTAIYCIIHLIETQSLVCSATLHLSLHQ